MVNEISNEYLDRLSEARRWLKRAKNDYRGYAKVVGRQYLSSKKDLPEDAALAVYLIQQSIEKTVKAVALASGQFESRELRKEYSHNSLKLLSDMLLKLIDIPMIQSALSVMKAGLGKTSEKYLDVNDIRKRIIDVKQNTDFNRPPDVPDWMKELALLPPQAVKPVVTVLSDLRSKLQSALYKLLKPNVSFDFEKAKNYLAEPTDSNLQGIFGPAFRTEKVPQVALSVAVNMFPIFKGNDFYTLLAEAIKKESRSLRGRVKVGKRQEFEETVFAGWALCTLMLLAAFTFPHEGWTRYPDKYKSNADLDCDSYTGSLGIVSCLREIGNLTRDTISDTDKLLETIAGFFAIHSANIELASK